MLNLYNVMSRHYKNVALAFASVLLAFFLIKESFAFFDYDWLTVLKEIWGVGLTWAFLFFVLTVLDIALAAYKWHWVKKKYQSQKTYWYCYKSILIGTFLGQILPTTVSITVTKAIATKYNEKVSSAKSLFVASFDQIFDFLIPVTIFPVAIAYLTGEISVRIAFIGVGAILLLFIAGSFLFGSKLFVLNWAKSVPRLAGLFTSFTAYDYILLCCVSFIKYTLLCLRLYIGVIAFQGSITFFESFFGNVAVQISRLISLTPGSIGVSEWGWSSLLYLHGVSLQDSFVIFFSIRVLIFVVLATLFLLFVVPNICSKLLQATQSATR